MSIVWTLLNQLKPELFVTAAMYQPLAAASKEARRQPDGSWRYLIALYSRSCSGSVILGFPPMRGCDPFKLKQLDMPTMRAAQNPEVGTVKVSQSEF